MVSTRCKTCTFCPWVLLILQQELGTCTAWSVKSQLLFSSCRVRLICDCRQITQDSNLFHHNLALSYIIGLSQKHFEWTLATSVLWKSLISITCSATETLKESGKGGGTFCQGGDMLMLPHRYLSSERHAEPLSGYLVRLPLEMSSTK